MNAVAESRKLAIMLAGAYAGGVSALNLLSASPDCDVVTVLTPTGPSGDQIRSMCAKRGITVISAELVKDPAFASDLLLYGVDLGISVQCPYIICPEVLAAAKIGWFNLHGGPLPRYAGAKPTQAAISRGEKEYGVTLHWMTPETDAGAIVAQTMFPLRQDHTWQTLLIESLRKGMPLIQELLTLAKNSSPIPRIEQDLSRREYFGRASTLRAR